MVTKIEKRNRLVVQGDWFAVLDLGRLVQDRSDATYNYALYNILEQESIANQNHVAAFQLAKKYGVEDGWNPESWRDHLKGERSHSEIEKAWQIYISKRKST